MLKRWIDVGALSVDERGALEAELLRRAAGSARGTGGPQCRALGTAVPLSLAQRRLWFFHQLEPDQSLYQSSACFQLAGSLDEAALASALASVVARHEVLRTRIDVDTAGEPVQLVDPPGPLELPVTDLSSAPGLARDGQARRLALAFIDTPFNLAEQWPIRAQLVRLNARRHLLVLALHHIVSDGWSLGVLYRDLAAYYDAALDSRAPDLPELPIQYADFALWNATQVDSPRWQADLEYWTSRLAGAPQVIDLPTDRRRGSRTSYAGAVVPLEISSRVTEDAQALGARADATLFMTLLAAFNTLLHRYSAAEDVMTGTPVTGRRDVRLENLVGFFVDTLALRTEFHGDPDFRTLLGRVRDGVLEAFDHQDVPFDTVVEALGGERGLSHNPVFQVMFQLNSLDRNDLRLRGLTSTRLWYGKPVSQFDLNLYLNETPSGIRGWLTYATDLFDHDSATRIARHFTTLVENLVAAPDLPVSSVEFLRQDERRDVTAVLSQGPAAPGAARLAHEYVDHWAATTPDAVAVEHDGQHLTYADLSRRTTQLANYLRGRGVGPEQLVGVMVKPSLDMLVAVLGVLKAGAGYLPVDPDYPDSWIDYVLADSGTRLTVTTAALADRVPGVETLCLEQCQAAIDGQPHDAAEVRGVGENLAYVIYTGGSTGRPKGVMVAHASLANHIAHGVSALRITAADRCLQFASLSFDASAEEIFGVLAAGATLLLRGKEFDLSPDAFVRRCDELGVTVLPLPTAYWHELVDAGAAGALGECAALRTVAIGGEAVAPDRVRRWRREVPGRPRLLNGYGPTEATITSTWMDLTDASDRNPAPIGRPIANSQLYVLDEAGNPVGVGVAGELYLGGAGVTRGYLGRPDLTAAAFLPDPFSEAPGARLYRTGDRGRYLPDGNVVPLGRTDLQIKLRGFRIEPADIEMTLREHDGVRDAQVLMRADTTGEPRLTAYLVPAGPLEHRPQDEALRRFLGDRLPAYMVPSAFVAVDTIPRTPSGKLDAGRLPAPPPPEAAAAAEPPRTVAELRLLSLWEELIGAEGLGVEDDFFQLGGHSLLAVKLVARIAQEFGQSVPVSALFPRATVARMATLVDTDTQVNEESVIRLRDDPDGRTVVLAHPVGGDVVGYFSLARALPGPLQVYATRAPGLGGEDLHFTDIGAMAANYLARVRDTGVTTVDVFAGWSMGGLVALEMAQQFWRRHGVAPPVVAIDATLEGTAEWTLSAVDTERHALGSFIRDLGRILGLPLRRAADSGAEPDARLLALHEDLAEAGVAPAGADATWVHRLFRTFTANAEAAAKYQPVRYPGPVTLLLSADRPDHDQVVDRWRAVAGGGLTVRPVPADHYSIVRATHLADLVAAWPNMVVPQQVDHLGPVAEAS